MSDDKFSRFREQYKTFTYEDYHITKDDIIPNCKGYQKVAQNYFLKGESNYGF